MIGKAKLGKYVIGFQGFYYFITGLWASISLESFNAVVGHTHPGPGFEMHSIAAMSVVLGLYYLHIVRKPDWFKTNRDIAYLVIGVALAVVLVELVYLPGMGFNLFWFDMVEEAIIAILLFGVVKK